jgi:hypothetical protein
VSDISPVPVPSGERRRAVPPRAVAALVIALVAIVGGFAGAAIDRYVVRQGSGALVDTTFHPLSQALRVPTDADRRRLREQLTRELHLSAAQDSTIDSIMNHRVGEFNALRDEMRPRVERLVLDVRADIEQVLTPDQRTRFHEIQQAQGTVRARTDLHASGAAVAQP